MDKILILFIILIMIVTYIALIILCLYYKRKSDCDSLSGLLNRNAVEKRINKLISKQKYMHTMLMIDINDFKSFNDTYGHDIGDDIIKHISYSLEKYFEKQCIIGRVGGDEFVVFTICSCDNFDIYKATENFLSNLFITLKDGERIKVECSVGIAHSSEMDNFHSIYCRSDKAMYDAKALRNLNVNQNKTGDFG